MQSADDDLTRTVIKFLSDRGYLTNPMDVFDLMIELRKVTSEAGSQHTGQGQLRVGATQPKPASTPPSTSQVTSIPETEQLQPAVSPKKSIHPDYLICLEDGQRVVLLRRYLKARYNMTPDQYRIKWGLPPDYPMVAPNFAERKSLFAKQTGFGRSHRPEFKEHYDAVKRQLNIGSKKSKKPTAEQISETNAEEPTPAA